MNAVHQRAGQGNEQNEAKKSGKGKYSQEQDAVELSVEFPPPGIHR